MRSTADDELESVMRDDVVDDDDDDDDDVVDDEDDDATSCDTIDSGDCTLDCSWYSIPVVLALLIVVVEFDEWTPMGVAETEAALEPLAEATMSKARMVVVAEDEEDEADVAEGLEAATVIMALGGVVGAAAGWSTNGRGARRGTGVG